MSKTVVVRIPEDIHAQAKLVGAMQGVKWTVPLQEAVTEYIAKWRPLRRCPTCQADRSGEGCEYGDIRYCRDPFHKGGSE